MKTLIIYKTIFGASKKYADWIQEDTGGKILKLNFLIKKEDIENADKIVLVGATYMGMNRFGGFIKKYEEILNKKKVFYVNVGMAPENDLWNQQSWNKLPQDFRNKAKIYKVVGKMKKEDESGIKKENISKIIGEILK